MDLPGESFPAFSTPSVGTPLAFFSAQAGSDLLITHALQVRRAGETMKRYGVVLFGLATVFAQPLAGQDYVKYTLSLLCG